MAKLVYIDLSISNLKTNGNFNTPYASGGAYFNSLVFTKDGHLITHGVDYSIASTITSVAAIAGGSAGNILYQSSLNVTAFIATPANNGNYFVTYTGTTPSLTAFNGYKLRLNLESDNTNWTNAAGTDILNGTGIYAPTSSGSSDNILLSNGLNQVPTWKASLLKVTDESTSTTNGYKIPTYLKVLELISNSISSLFSWLGDATVTNNTLTIPSNPKVGYAYRIPSSTTLPQTNSAKNSAETLEKGDVIICTSTSGPKFATLNTNWAISKDTGEVTIGTLTTVFTVGGVDLKLTVNAPSGWKTTDTTHSFYLGGTGASANATSDTSNPYLTTKLSSAEAATSGTNIVQFKGTTYLTVSGKDGIITFTNNGIKTLTYSPTITSNTGYEIGKLTINGVDSKIYGALRKIYYNNGTSVTTLFEATSTKGLYLKAGNDKVTISKGTATNDYEVLEISATDTNTWREVDVYKIENNVLDGTIDILYNTSIGTNKLKFSSTFSVNSGNEVDLVWEEVSSNGAKTYHV